MNQILTTTLDAPLTAALKVCAGRERVTLPNVLHAAMLAAVHHKLYQGERRPLRGMSFINLRPWLSPPLSADHLGCYIAMHRFTCMHGDQSGFWERARRIGDASWRAAHRGEKFLAPQVSRFVMKALFQGSSERMAASALSFSGAVSEFEKQCLFPVKEVHGFVSNMYLGPELSALARIHRGVLTWDYLYLDTDMDRAVARSVADHVTTILRDAVAQSKTAAVPISGPTTAQPATLNLSRSGVSP